MDKNKNEHEVREETAPVFKKWSIWYAIVLGNLALIILLLYWLTKAFSG